MFGESVWHLFSAAALLGAGYAGQMALRHHFECSIRRAALLYGWHAFFCMTYAIYVFNDGGDALGYYLQPLNPATPFQPGTHAVRHITQSLKLDLGLSFIGVSLIFNFVGSVGLLAFDASVRSVAGRIRHPRASLLQHLSLLPSLSFWSCGIGKDSLAFLATGLLCWASLRLGRRALLVTIAFGALLIIRPHMAALLVVALSVAYLLQTRTSPVVRVLLGVVSAITAAYAVPFAMDTVGVGSDADVDDVIEYVELRQSYNMTGGGAIDVSSMSLPLQMFTYLFRPLPFEAHNVFAFAASLDNVVLLGLFGAGIRAAFRRRGVRLEANLVFLAAYGGAAWLMFSPTTANLGIAMRQKWMFAPMLMLLALAYLSRTSRHPGVGAVASVRPSLARHRSQRRF